MIDSEISARQWIEALPGVDDAAVARLDLLVALLAEENQRQNLVSAASLDEVWQRHIADSAQLLAHVPRETSSPWLDLGTGAGFPGLVIAALRPDIDVVMVESRPRRVEWLEAAVAAMGLTQARVVGCKLELVETQAMQVISARAFASLDKLLELSARFSTTDTLWLLPKGRSARDEVNQLSGWAHLFHVEQSLTNPEAGIVVGTLEGKVARKKGRKS